MLCPKDMKPCCDDLCYGGGCLQMDGYPMLDVCPICNGTIDEENPDLGSCSCNPYDDFDEQASKQDQK